MENTEQSSAKVAPAAAPAGGGGAKEKIEKQASKLNGEFKFSSELGSGFSILIVIPIEN